MRRFTVFTLLLGFAVSASAHHPDRENMPVHPRIDLIGPLGTGLPISYRRRYNRPSNLGGKIAYWIAPSSQEAMAWHDATHRRLYENDRPRIEKHFFYPKPWEALRIGPRTPIDGAVNVDSPSTPLIDLDGYQSELPTGELDTVPIEPLTADDGLIEE